MSLPNHPYMVHCLGEKVYATPGIGVFANVIEVYEYGQDSWIVGRRYTAADGQGLVDVSICRYLEHATAKARRMAREPAD